MHERRLLSKLFALVEKSHRNRRRITIAYVSRSQHLRISLASPALGGGGCVTQFQKDKLRRAPIRMLPEICISRLKALPGKLSVSTDAEVYRWRGTDYHLPGAGKTSERGGPNTWRPSVNLARPRPPTAERPYGAREAFDLPGIEGCASLPAVSRRASHRAPALPPQASPQPVSPGLYGNAPPSWHSGIPQ